MCLSVKSVKSVVKNSFMIIVGVRAKPALGLFVFIRGSRSGNLALIGGHTENGTVRKSLLLGGLTPNGTQFLLSAGTH